ncbi:major facilitator superfamily domain-containing protein [Tribonema minus]|uniref:Major facilitator superfamily domain-containing protein n=1 Tax=Tribonema minus TaxID=303371 RepID=A0A835ZK48_9STRA|nr:major facilitator superfamily domain-containing protein [Tribonema minus]
MGGGLDGALTPTNASNTTRSIMDLTTPPRANRHTVDVDRSLKQSSFVVFLYLLSVGVMIPIFPTLLMQESEDRAVTNSFLHFIGTSNLDRCLFAAESSVQIPIFPTLLMQESEDRAIPIFPTLLMQESEDRAVASVQNGYMTVGKCALEFFVMPVVGACSDHVGRKPLLLFSAAVALAEYLAMAVSPTLPVIFVTRVLGGMTNGITTMIFAAISDVSKKSDEANVANNMGLVGAAFGVAFIIGPLEFNFYVPHPRPVLLVGGGLGMIHYSLPCWASAMLMAADVVFLHYVWQETLPTEQRTSFDIKNASPLPALRIFKPNLASLLPAVIFIYMASGSVFTWFIFVDFRFGWKAEDIGVYLACVGLAIAFTQGYLMRHLVPKGYPMRHLVPKVVSEEQATVVGFGLRAIAYTGYALSSKPWMLYALIMVDAMGSISDPCLSAALVARVDAHEVGALQGAAASVKTVMQGIGSFIFSSLLARFIGQGGAPPLLNGRLPGGHWLLASVLSVIAMVAARRSFARHHKARGAVSDMDAAEARERGGSHPEMVELLHMPPQ